MSARPLAVPFAILMSIATAAISAEEEHFDVLVTPTRAPTSAGNHDGGIRYCATLDAAREAARDLHRADAKRTISIGISPGTYYLTSPFSLDYRDSNTAWRSAGHASCTIISGVSSNQWSPMKDGCWHTIIAPAGATMQFPNVLLVDGAMAPLNRFPLSGTLHFSASSPQKLIGGAMVKSKSVTVRKEDIPKDFFKHPGIQMIVPHYWVDSHLVVDSFDEANSEVVFRTESDFRFNDDFEPLPGVYWFENAPDPIAPGHWTCNDATREIRYRPLDHQQLSPASFVTGSSNSVIEITGDPLNGHFANGISLSGIEIIGSDARFDGAYVNEQQGSFSVPASIQLWGAQNCSVLDCRIHDCSGYGIGILGACSDCVISGCSIHHIGSGGIKITGGAIDTPAWKQSHDIEVSRNDVSDYGIQYHDGIGILLQQAFNCKVDGNSVRDGDYTAISVGWTWGYGPSLSKNNQITNNLIDDIGRGALSDLAGIYTLGVQPGTRILHNSINNVHCRKYGGWGIYLDEGSSNILVNENRVTRTSSGSLHLHFGHENHISNNVFALGDTAQLTLTRADPGISLYFDHNIIYWTKGDALKGTWTTSSVNCDSNCWWCVDPASAKFTGMSFAQWEGSGIDPRSIFSDPKFIDPSHTNYQLAPDSPALPLGCRSLDYHFR